MLSLPGLPECVSGRAVLVSAVALVLTSVVFLMPAMSRAQSDEAPAAGQPAASPARLSVERLIARGDDLMARRDVASARLLYELAAAQGSAQAAARVGVTYDPWSLKQRGVQGKFADSRMAADWYRTAVKGGYAKANVPLKRLLAKAVPKPQKAKPQASEAAVSKPVTAKLETARLETAKLAEPEPEDVAPEIFKPEIFKPEPSGQPAAGGAFWVQLASLATRAYANKELARIQQAHGDLIGNKNLILKRRVLGDGDKIMIGIQTGPFADPLAARILCAKLKSKRQDCFVVP